MARYGQAFKDRAVARLLPPESAPLEVVAREMGLGAATLERWRSHALAKPAGQRVWTAAALAHPVAGRMPGHMNVLLAEAKGRSGRRATRSS